MIVAKISPQQAEELTGTEFLVDNYFNPVQDIEGNWIISLQELVYCDINFANTVDLIEYKPIVFELDFM